MNKMFFTGAMMIIFFAAIPFTHAAGVDLAWDKPTEGGAAEGYKIYWKEAGGSYNDANCMSVIGAMSGTVSGLDESKTYFFIVKAYNDAGLGPASNEVAWSYSDTTPPSQPQGVSVY